MCSANNTEKFSRQTMYLRLEMKNRLGNLTRDSCSSKLASDWRPGSTLNATDEAPFGWESFISLREYDFWVISCALLLAPFISSWETRKLRLAGAWKKRRVEWFSFIVSFVLHTTFDDDDDVVKSSGADNSATSWCWPANVPTSSRVAQFTSSTLWRRSIIGFDGFFSAFK